MTRQNDTSPPLPDLHLAFVPGGAFLMGADVKSDPDASSDEDPPHRVAVPAFYMMKYPVTQRLWKAVMGSEEHSSYFQGDKRPKTNVSWNEAQQFIEALNGLDDVQKWLRSLHPPPPAHKGEFRLPSEAEWEYAARGGNAFPETGEVTSGGFKYPGSDKLSEVGWYDDNSHDETKPVGLKFPNELGLFDMSGNVWEWCQDWLEGRYYVKYKAKGTVENPVGPESGSYRVIRGGSWNYLPARCRTAFRHGNGPVYRDGLVGFRLVLVP